MKKKTCVKLDTSERNKKSLKNAVRSRYKLAVSSKYVRMKTSRVISFLSAQVFLKESVMLKPKDWMGKLTSK